MTLTRRLAWAAVFAATACEGAATRPDGAAPADARAGADADLRIVDASISTTDAAGFDATVVPADARTCAAGGFAMDGVLDEGAAIVAGGDTSPRLAVTIDGAGVLYVATDDAGEGSDHFILVSATAPGARTLHAPFGKAGDVAAGDGDLTFAADENDNLFVGWFRLEAAGADTPLSDPPFSAATGANGGVLETQIDLATAFGAVPSTIYLAVAVYGTTDGGALVAAAQTPAGNGDGDVDADEFVAVLTACTP